MEQKKKSYPVVHIGTSLLLVIFIVLCLVTFSVLSLSSALRDQGYTEKEASRTVSYYEANGNAQEKLSEIVQAFDRHTLDSVSDITFDSGDATSSKAVISYEIAMNDSQALSVQVKLSSAKELTNGSYQIAKWKEISSSEWDGDGTLPVIGSE